ILIVKQLGFALITHNKAQLFEGYFERSGSCFVSAYAEIFGFAIYQMGIYIMLFKKSYRLLDALSVYHLTSYKFCLSILLNHYLVVHKTYSENQYRSHP